MFGRSWTVHSPTSRTVSHVLAAMVLAIGLTMLSAGTAQACPPGKNESALANIAHQAKRAVAVMSVASTPSLIKAFSLGGGQCCGGGSHSHSVGCANGCCSACSAAIDVMSSSVDLPDGSIRHGLFPPSRVVSTKPPPDHRPPRTMA